MVSTPMLSSVGFGNGAVPAFIAAMLGLMYRAIRQRAGGPHRILGSVSFHSPIVIWLFGRSRLSHRSSPYFLRTDG
jgi:hypothetical protein